MVTIFKNIFDKQPYYISVEKALQRIQRGDSKQQCELIRSTIDKERANQLKANLPAICFSGKFTERKDDKIIQHSGYVCLDFDNLHDVIKEKERLKQNKYIYACWISPSGNGLKALVRIADGKKHREHFDALQDEFKTVDQSGKNESRVCYESYDPNIYINQNAEIFKTIKKYEKEKIQIELTEHSEVFSKILKWLSNKGDAFVKGERNFFMFKLASACCRFGIREELAFNMASAEFTTGSDFSQKELEKVFKSAYKTSASNYGSAIFERDILVTKTTKKEIEIDVDIYNPDIKPKDVIYGEDVKDSALSIYDNGYDKVIGIDVEQLDNAWKPKRGEITLLSGIGNYGKSTFLKWYLIMRIIKHKEKFALFAPEDNPPFEFYHDLTEIYLGADCTPLNFNRPNKEAYEQAYDEISKHIFYLQPQEQAPTPEYIKQRFLELIIKEKIDGCIIDPFNQLTNDYASAGGRSDKYLETILSDFHRFAQLNNSYFIIVAHPHKLRKEQDGNYPCPDVFDIADGAMWNNKMDNIIIFHKPLQQTDPRSNECELHSKKIRRQKTVGKRGMVKFEFDFNKRRFYFDGVDPIHAAPEKRILKSNFEKFIEDELF